MSFFLILLPCLYSYAGSSIGYEPLDKTNPISFQGDHIVYQGKKIILGPKSFFIDGQLPDIEITDYPYVFNSVNEALKHITDGSESDPMTLYIAPSVYWIDDPDDPEIRKPAEGTVPYGKTVKCNWLTFYGLTDNPVNVVLASSRGQTQGAEGNFTMFYFDGDGISSENITFGNYCNVDLEYPLLPSLGRAKRSSTIAQAQLIICNSDKVVARNTHFISRLNLCPFAGGGRIIFDRCYFESTDDALCGTGLYLNCKFTFFSSKPFYSTRGTGAVFLNCDFDVLTKNKQYLTKVGSPVVIVDSRFNTSGALTINWTPDPTDDLRCYQYNVTLNDNQILIGKDKPWLTVDMTDKKLLEAYRIEHHGQVIYNTYNLLRGDDDWDPMGVKEQILHIEKDTGKNLTNIPVYMDIYPSEAFIESGVTTLDLTATVKRFGNYELSDQKINWRIDPVAEPFVILDEKGTACEVRGRNEEENAKVISVEASVPIGLQSAAILTVSPEYLEAPAFISLPEIGTPELGVLTVNYKLDLGEREDQSLITWYRCMDAKGKDAKAVAVSRGNKPKLNYTLSPADAGYYIMASVAPKHVRSHPGKTESYVMSNRITLDNIIDSHSYYTDFFDFPVTYQPKVIPGFWTVDSYKPLDLGYYNWKTSPEESWFYGKGIDGMEGNGLLQAVRGARLLYTPVKNGYKDMTVTLNVDPGKQAGQGFGSATGQYLELYIKYDTKTLSGYGLRIVRTTKYDHAVDFILMRYNNGVATEISKPISSVCYRTDCTITLSVKNNKLKAHAETKTPLTEPLTQGLVKVVNLEADIIPNESGGVGIQHTGSVGASATMLHWIKVDWE